VDDKITIIEGPPPAFEAVNENWVLGLNEGSVYADIVLTRLRTFNGPALVERCYKTWKSQGTIQLEYRTSDGLQTSTPIVAARIIESDEGQMLLLWLRLADESVELEMDLDDDEGEEGN